MTRSLTFRTRRHRRIRSRDGLFVPTDTGAGSQVRRNADGCAGREVHRVVLAEPLRRTLRSVVDLERLNDGPVRITPAATDVSTGERVVFDNRRGEPARPTWLMA